MARLRSMAGLTPDEVAISEVIRGAQTLKAELDELAPYLPPAGQAAKIARETHAFIGEALEGWQHCAPALVRPK